MWRTLIINSAQRMRVKDQWIVVENDDGEQRIPVTDLYSVVIDNPQATLSVSAINTLTENNVHILYCGENHLPQSLVLPYNTHYSPLAVVQKQLSWTKEFCDLVWKIIVQQKIENQAAVLRCAGRGHTVSDHLIEFSSQVLPGDPGNREGLAAKMFFRDLYGSNFVRMSDDGINHALNYGYAILRSSIAKTLCAYGYNPVVGIHHIGKQNPFNLADDLLEPFRPLVDLWVDRNIEDIGDELTKDNRRKLINLVNEVVEFDGKKTKVRYAIDRCVSSLTSATNQNKPEALKLPTICSATLDEMRTEWEDD